MTTLKAHFDGRVLVPDEPVDLPRDRPLVVQVLEVATPAGNGKAATGSNGAKAPGGLPVFDVPPTARIFTTDDVRRAEDDL